VFEVVQLCVGVTTIVGVLHGIDNFSVLELIVEDCYILIYDSLSYSLTTWFKHAFGIPKHLKVIPIETVYASPSVCNDKYEYQFGDATLTLFVGEQFLKTT